MNEENGLPGTTGLEVGRSCYVSFKPRLQCHPPRIQLFLSPCSRALLTLLDPNTWTITSMLFTYTSVSLEKLRVPLRQGQSQTYLHGPALRTAPGTKMSELLPAAKCPCHMPELPAGLFLPRQPLRQWAGLQLQLLRKAQAPPEAHNGPFDSADWALSGKTHSLPQHLSLKPAFLQLWGNTEQVFIKKQEQGHEASRASRAERSDFWEDGRKGGKVERAFHQQSCWHSGSVNRLHRGREGEGVKIKEYKE